MELTVESATKDLENTKKAKALLNKIQKDIAKFNKLGCGDLSLDARDLAWAEERISWGLEFYAQYIEDWS